MLSGVGGMTCTPRRSTPGGGGRGGGGGAGFGPPRAAAVGPMCCRVSRAQGTGVSGSPAALSESSERLLTGVLQVPLHGAAGLSNTDTARVHRAALRVGGEDRKGGVPDHCCSH
jgi:hypothetical protein